MSTEYEQLLARLVEERKEKLAKLGSGKGKEKQVEALGAEIRYIELEIDHYQRGLALFRSKKLPKVGRWGKPEEEEEGHKPPAA